MDSQLKAVHLHLLKVSTINSIVANILNKLRSTTRTLNIYRVVGYLGFPESGDIFHGFYSLFLMEFPDFSLIFPEFSTFFQTHLNNK